MTRDEGKPGPVRARVELSVNHSHTRFRVLPGLHLHPIDHQVISWQACRRRPTSALINVPSSATRRVNHAWRPSGLIVRVKHLLPCFCQRRVCKSLSNLNYCYPDPRIKQTSSREEKKSEETELDSKKFAKSLDCSAKSPLKAGNISTKAFRDANNGHREISFIFHLLISLPNLIVIVTLR